MLDRKARSLPNPRVSEVGFLPRILPNTVSMTLFGLGMIHAPQADGQNSELLITD